MPFDHGALAALDGHQPAHADEIGPLQGGQEVEELVERRQRDRPLPRDREDVEGMGPARRAGRPEPLRDIGCRRIEGAMADKHRRRDRTAHRRSARSD